jgi:hypothetical protein
MWDARAGCAAQLHLFSEKWKNARTPEADSNFFAVASSQQSA